jgi:hypothetical protein
MALALTLRKGQAFFAGGIRIVCSTIRSPFDFDVRVGPTYFNGVGEHEWVEVSPEVKVKAGVPQDSCGDLVRILIDAPKSIKITRESKGTDARVKAEALFTKQGD